MDNILDELLGVGEDIEMHSDRLELPEKVHASRNVIEKAYAICDAVKKFRGDCEWYGLMVSRKASPDVIADIAIEEQDSSAAHTSMSGEQVNKLVSAAKQRHGDDYFVSGWMHSHADFTTFFSSTDTENMLTVLNSVWTNNQRCFMYAYKLIEGKRTIEHDKARSELVVKGSLSTDGEVRVPAEKDAGFLSKAYIRLPVIAGVSYSIVVNNKHDSRGAVSVRLAHSMSNAFEDKSYDDMPVEVLEGEEFAPNFSTQELEAEVREKIKRPKWRSSYTRVPAWQKSYQPFDARPAQFGNEQYLALGGMQEKKLPQVSAEEFLATALSYEIVNVKLKKEAEILSKILARAIEKGKAGAMSDSKYSGRPSCVISALVPDDVFAAIDAYAAADNDFARFMQHFVYPIDTRRSTIIHSYAKKEGIR